MESKTDNIDEVQCTLQHLMKMHAVSNCITEYGRLDVAENDLFFMGVEH